MNPVEVIEKALVRDLRLRLGKRALTDAMLDKPIRLSGGEAEEAARIAVDALAGADMLRSGDGLREALNLCGRLISCHSRDWGLNASDATLWALLVGWECEDDHTHDDICGGSGALHEVADRFGWDQARVERIRRLRHAVAASPERTGDVREPS